MMDSLIVGSKQKNSHPNQKSHLLADGTPNENDRIETGPTKPAYDEWAAAGLTEPRYALLCGNTGWRVYSRKLSKHDHVPDCYYLIRLTPVSATDTSNMQLWIAHIVRARSVLKAAAGQGHSV